MTLLWISLSAGAAVTTIIALHSLDQQRRLFFTHAGWKQRRVGGGRKAGDYLRHGISTLRDLFAGMTVDGSLRTARVRSDMFRDWLLRRFSREHAARVVLRAMSAAGPAPAPSAGPSTPYPETTPHAEPAAAPAPRLLLAPTEVSAPPTDHAAASQPTIESLIVTASAAGEGIVRVDASGQLKFPDPIARDLLQWPSGERALGDLLVGGPREATALLESVARQPVAEHDITVLTGGSPQQLHVTALASHSRDGSLWGALLILRRR